ncbi:hypothetical protein DsansV1_C04g0046161 [Dioscorea sansibarensis]
MLTLASSVFLASARVSAAQLYNNRRFTANERRRPAGINFRGAKYCFLREQLILD